MKKIISLLLFICIAIAMTSCNLGQKNDHSQGQIDDKNESIYEQLNRANFKNGGCAAEDSKYIFYKNIEENCNVYRRDKESGQDVLLYKNTSDGFLHSISIYENKIYFVTKGSNAEEKPYLVQMDYDGNNVTKIVDNVGDDYIVRENFIYYSSVIEDNQDIFYLYKHNVSDNKSELLVGRQCEYFNMVGEDIYFINFEYDSQLCKVNTVNGKITTFDTGEVTVYDKLYYLNNSLYFFGYLDDSVLALYKMNLSDETLQRVTDEKELLKDQDEKKYFFTLTQYLMLNENHLYFLFDVEPYNEKEQLEFNCILFELNNNESSEYAHYKGSKSDSIFSFNRLNFVESKPEVF